MIRPHHSEVRCLWETEFSDGSKRILIVQSRAHRRDHPQCVAHAIPVALAKAMLSLTK